MGLLQEAAIFMGDHVTQPIRARIHERRTGIKVRIEKVVIRGTGSFKDEKSVDWYLRSIPDPDGFVRSHPRS